MEQPKTRVRKGKKRPSAGRKEILEAALSIGTRAGWKAVTIRSVAQELGYASPLLYEHFQNKEDLLTQLAIQGLRQLEAAMLEHLPEGSHEAVTAMAARYWRFLQEFTSLYRLVNGMDGAGLDNSTMRDSAATIGTAVAKAVTRLLGSTAPPSLAYQLADELWALLHGMAVLHLDRGAEFTLLQVESACMRLVEGTRSSLQTPQPSSRRDKIRSGERCVRHAT